MFSKSAKFYNAIYASIGKDHAAEAYKVHDIIQEHKKSAGNTLLEVACGTSIHASVLREFCRTEVLDLDPEMLAVAMQDHDIVGTPRGIEFFKERHELGLFTQEEYTKALQKAGLEVTHDPEGLDERGLYVGLKS